MHAPAAAPPPQEPKAPNAASPLVSVVIPCYNHEDYIEQSVLSVLAQTYQNIQLIVVNDGSTDTSGKVLDHLALKHSFDVIHQDNAGVSAAMNAGLNITRGSYIATLDSDDLFLSDKIAKQVSFLNQNPHIAICGGNMVIINKRGELSLPRRFSPYRELDFEDVLLEKKDIIPASSAMIRREVIDTVGGYNANYRIQDLYFWLTATHAGFRIAGLNDLLIYYRKHDSNNHDDHRAVTKDMLNIYHQYAGHPSYNHAREKLLKSMFLKTSKKDKSFALSLINKIPLARYDLKVIRGIFRLLIP